MDQYTKTVDLCSPSALEDIKYTELLPPVVVLEWQPAVGVKGEDVLALEMVFAAVGRGKQKIETYFFFEYLIIFCF